MPRVVVAADRKRDIIEAAMGVLAEDGFEGLTLRKVGQRLGGSTSLVTHYYPTKDSLLDDLPRVLASKWQTELDALIEVSIDRSDALTHVLLWLIPNTDEKVHGELGRLQFSAASHRNESAARVLLRFDAYVRSCLVRLLEGAVPESDIEGMVDMLRVIATGIELETVEHRWSVERQEAALRNLVGLLPIPA